ncbi:CRISPR system precrRNA processing endoribonuclease RAMP protein Cas6 [Nitratifractor sp.]
MEYCRVGVKFLSKKDPPFFIGSQIRGALGYSLKRVVCIHPSMRCDGCFAVENCLYHRWYEEQGGYHPYRLDFRLGGTLYDFSLYFFGDAVEKLPYLISAIDRMLRIHGLGKERQKIEEYELSIDGRIVNAEGAIALPERYGQSWQEPEKVSSNVILRFVTPLRIKQNNRFVRDPEMLELRTLLNSIHQRVRMLEGKEWERLPFEVQGRIVDVRARFRDLTRYSGRQRGHLKIGGLLGELRIEGLEPQEYRLLRLGELVGVGKQTVFGLGKIEVEDTI